MKKPFFWLAASLGLLIWATTLWVIGLFMDGDTAPSADDYRQTWTQSYGQTSCTDWRARMTDEQRFVAAADILTSARNQGDGGSGLPAERLTTAFERDITMACETAGSSSIAEIGATIYLVGRAQYGP